MSKLLKIVVVNLLVLVVTVQAVMITVSVAGDIWDQGKLIWRTGDKKGRHLLPNYDDKNYARRVFEDQRKTVESYSSFTGWRRLPLQTETTTIGVDGLRLHTTGRDNAPQSKTLGFFGGSTAWGTGVDDNNTIPANLDELTDRYEITNYGETGWTSRQSLAQLINLMTEGKAPDIVVFYDGANDTTVHCNLGFGTTLNIHHETKKLEMLVRNFQSRSYLYRNFIVPAFDTFQRVTGYIRYPSEWACDRDVSRAAVVASHLVRNWEIARTLVESYGGQFIAILQPVTGVGKPKIDHLELDLARAANYAAAYTQIRSLLRDREASWIWDMSDTFDVDRRLYIDHAHVVGEGNALVAARIAKVLQTSVD
jgi:lysophospholipase L1-like esterase